MQRRARVVPQFRFGIRDQAIDPAVLGRLRKCKLTFKLKAGMTNQAASDAIDAGFDKFIECLSSAGKKRPTGTG